VAIIRNAIEPKQLAFLRLASASTARSAPLAVSAGTGEVSSSAARAGMTGFLNAFAGGDLLKEIAGKLTGLDHSKAESPQVSYSY